MISEHHAVCTFYKKLLTFYPENFRERLGESMEQTFRDLWNEKRQTKKALLGFVFRTFLETAVGIFREHLLLISPGDIMQNVFKAIGLPALLSLFLTFPFMIMEVVNRRDFNEDFPTFLFLVMWLDLFALIILLLPIVQSRRTRNRDMANVLPTQSTLLTKPAWAVIISIIVFISPGILPLMESFGWLSLDRLFNGPNPEVDYLPGMFLSLGFLLFPVMAGIIAGGPIVRTLRAGGSLFAHPVNLIIVVFIASTFAFGLITVIIDQWPCFVGVPNCD